MTKPRNPDPSALPASSRAAPPTRDPAAPAAEAGRRLDDALLASDPRAALAALESSGLLAHAVPEVTALRGLAPPPGTHHKDIWEHTLQVISATPPERVVRWAALLHDVGKVATRSVDPDGQVRFVGHAEVGARLVAERVAPRLGFSPALRDPVVLLVRYHQRVGSYDAAWTDAAVRRLGRAAGPWMDALLCLGRADVTSAIPGRRAAAQARVDALAERWRRIAEADGRPAPLPSGLGHALMAAFGLSPGPAVGRLRARLLRAVAAGRLPEGASVQACIAYLEGQGDASSAPEGDRSD